MFLYIMLILLVVNIGFYFYMPKYKANLIKQSNPELVQRIRSESDDSAKSMVEMKKKLIADGYTSKEISTAFGAVMYQRLGNNLSSKPYPIIICIVIIIFYLLK